MPETQSREFYVILKKIKGFYKEDYSQEKEECHSFLKSHRKRKFLIMQQHHLSQQMQLTSGDRKADLFSTL